MENKDKIGNVQVTFWRVRLTVVAVETQQRILCVAELHIAVSSIKILIVAQQYFFVFFAN